LGKNHGTTATRGTVFDRALADDGEHSLWLEHVIEIQTGDEYYWLMWYDSNGFPTMPMSGILSRDDIANMQSLFASFIP